MSLLLINPSLYKCYNYLIYINVLCASSVHPKGVNGIGCIIYIPFYPHVPYGIACIIYPIVFSCILWYCMYYTSHCILMYHMVLHVLYIPLYPDVPYGIACTMCRGGIVFHDFGAAHDVCLDPLVPSPGQPPVCPTRACNKITPSTFRIVISRRWSRKL